MYSIPLFLISHGNLMQRSLPYCMSKERYLNFEELNFEGLSALMSNKQDLKIYLNYKVIDYSLAKTGHRSILSQGCWQLKSLFLRLSEETSGSSRDKWHTILSPVSGVSGQDWHDMTILTQSPSHLASPWSEPGPRSQIGAGVSPVRAVHQPRLSCVPVILLAYCWTIMGFAAALRIYKFWLNYWFTIYPNNFTIFVCMHQFWARPLKPQNGNR